ncbi:unnamed protein product [Mytilus coruscus]|uniref:Reverse transcriptase domain-containing protein n=1 Tax=Mytilus coruscus TaxID=42192 RepID=A0A6J8A0F9_MYTCO|nr:unnamed protein product [Mytilus coruscus]
MSCKFKTSKYSGVGCNGQIYQLASLKSDDAELLLSEIGLLNTYKTEEYTICDQHLKYVKEENRLTWVRRKCCIPSSISAHKGLAKGDRKITKDVMCKILSTTGLVVPIGAPICTNCRKDLSVQQKIKPVETICHESYADCATSCIAIAEEKRERHTIVEVNCFSDADSESQPIFSQDSEASVCGIGRLEKLNAYLEITNVSPIKEKTTPLSTSCEKTRQKCVSKALECLTAICSTICPGEGEELDTMVLQATQTLLNEKHTAILIVCSIIFVLDKMNTRGSRKKRKAATKTTTLEATTRQEETQPPIIPDPVPNHFRRSSNDFIFGGSANSDDCLVLMNTFTELCNELGVPIAEDKTIHPITRLTFLGLEIDTVDMVVRIPVAKLIKLRSQLQPMTIKRNIKFKDFVSLVGLLAFCSRAVPSSRAFLRRFYDVIASFRVKKPFFSVRITSEIREDVMIWLEFLKSFNGDSYIIVRQVQEVSTIGGEYTGNSPSGVHRPDLQTEIDRLIVSAVAPNTAKVYQQALRSFNEFRALFQLEDLWPIPLHHITNYIAYMSFTGTAA